jgi:hypothetical protein
MTFPLHYGPDEHVPDPMNSQTPKCHHVYYDMTMTMIMNAVMAVLQLSPTLFSDQAVLVQLNQ